MTLTTVGVADLGTVPLVKALSEKNLRLVANGKVTGRDVYKRQVLHFGANEWDGPLSLHEMMAVKNKNLLNFVQDYQIHLIDPAKLSAEDLERFSSRCV